MAVLHLNKEKFEEIKNSEKPILLDFFATWCGPCRMVGPFIEEIAEENPQYIIAKIDVDENPDLAAEFDVSSIPTLVVMKNGQVVKREMGAKPKNQILAMLQD